MAYRGIVHQGVVILDAGVVLPEGTSVRIEIDNKPARAILDEAPPSKDEVEEIQRLLREITAVDENTPPLDITEEQLSQLDIEAFKKEMMQFCGITNGPSDMSERHDFYAYGKIDG